MVRLARLQTRAFPVVRLDELFEQQERLPPPRAVAKAAKSQDGNGLTFATKGEIIIVVERVAVLPASSLFFSPFLRLYSSFLIGSCLLRIRNF
jgi:hypothetical protein